TSPDVVARNGQRLDHGSVSQCQRGRETMQCVRRDCPRALKRPGGVNSEEFQILADVTMACTTGGALISRIQRHHSDPVANTESAHSRTYCSDGTGHFMPNDLGYLYSVVHFAVEKMQIGSTDPTMGYLDLNPSLRGFHRLAGAGANSLISFVKSSSHQS